MNHQTHKLNFLITLKGMQTARIIIHHEFNFNQNILHILIPYSMYYSIPFLFLGTSMEQASDPMSNTYVARSIVVWAHTKTFLSLSTFSFVHLLASLWCGSHMTVLLLINVDCSICHDPLDHVLSPTYLEVPLHMDIVLFRGGLCISYI